MSFVVPKECYINFQLDFDYKTGELNTESIPLGFATYKEDNKAFEKRKYTIDNWSSLRNRRYLTDEDGKTLRDDDGPVVEITEGVRPMETFTNKLMKGFKISREIKRYGWNGGNVVWRIEDPRGFELEISSQNMAQIMMNCTMYRGEIDTPCLWSWDKTGGSRIVLLPEGTEPFKEAMKDNDLHDSKISIKDINVLDKIQLKNGAVGTYYGCVSVIMHDYVKHIYSSSFRASDDRIYKEKNKWLTCGGTNAKEYFIRRRYMLKLEDGTFYAVSNLKPARLISKSELSLTTEQVVNEINNSLLDANVITNDYNISSYRDLYDNSKIIAVGESKQDLIDFQLKFVLTDDVLPPGRADARPNFDGEKIFKDGDGFFIFHKGHVANSNGFVRRVEMSRLKDNILCSTVKTDDKRSEISLGQLYYVAVEVNNNTYLINTRW